MSAKLITLCVGVCRCISVRAGELFVRKLASRVAARVAQDSLGSDPLAGVPGQSSTAFSPSPSYMAGRGSAGVGARGPLAGLLPDWLLP